MGDIKQKPKKKAGPTLKSRRPNNGAKNKLEMEERLEYVESLLVAGLRYRQAVRAIIEKWSVCRMTAEGYIKRVYVRWEAEGEEARPRKKRRATEHVREVFVRALNDKDYGSALRALELLMKMEGVAPDQVVKVEHSGKVEHVESENSLLNFIGTVFQIPEARREFMKKYKEQNAGNGRKDKPN